MSNKPQNNVFRLSIPVKVFLAAGLAYVAALHLTTWAAVYWGLDPAVLIFGFSIKEIFFGFQLFIAVSVFAIASHFFLDRPMKRLSKAISKAGEGDFLVRAPGSGRSEIGRLVADFNQMLEQLTDLSARKIQTDHDLILIKEQLKYRERLAEKKQELEKTNKQFENLVRDFVTLYEIGQGVNEAMELYPLYETISGVVKKRLMLENFSLMVWDERRSVLQVKAAFGFEALPDVLQFSLQSGEGIAGEVMRTGKVIYVEDISREPRFVKQDKINMLGSHLSVPLIY
ncbi:MAG: HAMP domain-containing protein [Deltaproteobacteria bacterium]|nr:HAMP domain-containing protein [Deltaproteobacteria bacterium]